MYSVAAKEKARLAKSEYFSFYFDRDNVKFQFCYFLEFYKLSLFSERKQEMADELKDFEVGQPKKKAEKVSIEERYGLFIEHTEDVDAENLGGMNSNFFLC